MAEASALRVLIVEDDPVMVALIRRLLEVSGYQQVTIVGSGAEALANAADTHIILLDYQLPDTTGIEVLPRLLDRPEPPSVIMVTGAGNETLAASALRAGAEDYVAKDGQLRELLPQILERIRRNRALRDARRAVESELVRAERLAAIGEMTVTLHHEINNPLMAASAEIELLAASPALTDDQRESVATIKTGLGRIRDIIRRAGDLRQAESRDYLAGLRMINLQSAELAARGQRGKALVWIPDEEVARLTALVLRHSGFQVDVVGSRRELDDGLKAGVSLVVIRTAGGANPAEALGGFSLDPDRRYAVVVLVAGDPSGARAAGADRVVTLPFDPATLADELVHAADQRGRPGETIG